MIINKNSEVRFNNWFNHRFPGHVNSVLESSLKDVLMESYKLGTGENVDLHFRGITIKFLAMLKESKAEREDLIDFLEKHIPVADETYSNTR